MACQYIRYLRKKREELKAAGVGDPTLFWKKLAWWWEGPVWVEEVLGFFAGVEIVGLVVYTAVIWKVVKLPGAPSARKDGG